MWAFMVRMDVRIIVLMSGEPELQSRGERNRGSLGVGTMLL